MRMWGNYMTLRDMKNKLIVPAGMNACGYEFHQMTLPVYLTTYVWSHVEISSLLFREVGTITYRSGPEWVERFGNKRREPEKPPDFCPDFEIERYLDRQVCATSLAGNDLQ